MTDISKALDAIMERVREDFASKNLAREKALPLCREAIRYSANAIRAVHRDDFTTARELAGKAGSQLAVAKQSLAGHEDIYHAGFVHDSQKEFAEASITLALISGAELPTPESLDVELPAYLNGMGEAVGELRRHLLDTLRSGDVERCEDWLRAMDEMYSVLVTVDYPDAMTGGLRRTTDSVRGILEKTRGDLTLSVQQRRLEQRLQEFGGKLGS
ncbi:MAG: haloacid dehalogenase [Chloroflexi bacterium]|nr:haloacid dehalogenase [Chloroflexota bacterium]